MPPPRAQLGGQEEQQSRRRRSRSRIISIEAGSGAASAILIFQAVFPFLLFAGSSDEPEQEQEQEQEPPIELSIHGGTNVSFSPSYEYLDQVLLPALQSHFGIRVSRRLERRRWSQGSSPSQPKGTIWFRFRPLRPGQTLKLSSSSPLSSLARPSSPPLTTRTRRRRRREPHEIARIDVSILAPAAVLAPLERAITRNLEAGGRFCRAAKEVRFVVTEDSGHDARLYALLVAVSETTEIETETETGTGTGTEMGALRWGRDWLYNRTVKRKTPEQLADEIARRVCRDLEMELSGDGGDGGDGDGDGRGVVDEYLQDQLVVFQALAEGRTSFPRSSGLSPTPVDDGGGGGGGYGDAEEDESEGENEDLEPAVERLDIGESEEEEERGEKRDEGGRVRRDKMHEPFGEGSTHTRTARWVASELLPGVQWFNGGSICDGVGLSFK